jgi:RNA polymerase sigma-70 factor (ECF subfamily)
MESLDERSLLEKVRNGDEASFDLLVKEHSGKIIGLAWRLIGHRDDAEDLAQEAFLRLYRSIGEFRGDSRISTWLYKTTTRLAIDYLRRERLKRKLFFFRSSDEAQDPIDMAPDPTKDPARSAQTQQAMQRLRLSLNKLSPRQQTIFMLRHYEGLPLGVIAEHLNLETGTVKAHLHRAVSHLRRELIDYHEVTS